MHQVTLDVPLTKLVPVTVMLMELAVPATALAGDTFETPEEEIVRLTELETTWLTESVTARLAMPDAVNRLAGTVTVMDVDVFEVMLVRGVVVPLNVQLTIVEVVGKLVPVSVRLKLPWPVVAAGGFRELSTGLGLIVKVWVVGPVPEPLFTPT